MKTIEWPMSYRTCGGGRRTLLVKIADLVTKEACNEAARLILERQGYEPSRIDPFHTVEEPAPNARPTFTHEELVAMWHMLSPEDGKWKTLGSAIAKLDTYVKRSRGEG